MRWNLLTLPILALTSWVGCNEQSNSPAAQGVELQSIQPQELSMEGPLSKVDPDSQRIRMADGTERSFRHFDQTLVTVAGDTVEGLGRVNGARVKVWYTISPEGNTAEEIEILTGQTKDPVDQGASGEY